jgi:hypothetical protein
MQAPISERIRKILSSNKLSYDLANAILKVKRGENGYIVVDNKKYKVIRVGAFSGQK